jgi:hypothetical protein
MILLIHCQGVILKMSLELIRHKQAGCARAYANDLDMSFRVDGGG